MKRSFKAATVFAGATALAGGAVGLVPAAHASSLRNQLCGAASSVHGGKSGTALHLYYPNNDHPAECFGGIGAKPETGNINEFCGGNNDGILFGVPDGHKNSTEVPVYATGHISAIASNLSTGDAANSLHLSGVSIYSVIGSQKCTTNNN